MFGVGGILFLTRGRGFQNLDAFTDSSVSAEKKRLLCWHITCRNKILFKLCALINAKFIDLMVVTYYRPCTLLVHYCYSFLLFDDHSPSFTFF